MKDDRWEVVTEAEPPRTEGPKVSADRKRRLAIAFAIAAISDFLSVWTEVAPPLQWAVDIITAALLFLVLGREWMILPGLIAEAIPGLAVLPFWVLVVGSIAVWGVIKPAGKQPPQP